MNGATGPEPHPPTLFIAERALAEITAETLEHFETETGGVLLGVEEQGSWYAVESLDPGPRAILEPSFFEYDHDYLTHLANKVARRYRRKIRLIGLWHRHPGSFDSFSAVDDGTNLRYADLLGGSAVSGLVNVDPKFRMTFYRVEAPPLAYRPIRVQTGDHHFPPDLLATRDSRDGERAINARGAQAVRSDGLFGRRRRPRTVSTEPDSREVAATPWSEPEDPAAVPPRAAGRQAASDQGDRQREDDRWDERHWIAGQAPAPRHDGPPYDDDLPMQADHRRDPYAGRRDPIPNLRALFRWLRSWLSWLARPVEESPGHGEAPEAADGHVEALEMLDSELEYLESQRQFSYSLSMPSEGLLISLTREDEGQPAHDRLELMLTARDGQRSVRVGDREMAFRPGVVEELVRDWRAPRQAALPVSSRAGEEAQ